MLEVSVEDVQGFRMRWMDGGERIRADAVYINAQAFELSCVACLM
jgi:hypothetical protein